MTGPIAFDPGATLTYPDETQETVEVVLTERGDSLYLQWIRAEDEGLLGEMLIRGDFLREFVAQARASEQSAA